MMYFHSIIRHSYVSLLSKNWFGLKTRLIDCHPKVNNLNPFKKTCDDSLQRKSLLCLLLDTLFGPLFTPIRWSFVWCTYQNHHAIIMKDWNLLVFTFVIISFLLSLDYDILNYLLCAWVHKESAWHESVHNFDRIITLSWKIKCPYKYDTFDFWTYYII